MSARHRRPLAATLTGLALTALAAQPARAIGCDELRSSVADKLARGGLPKVAIAIVDAADRRPGRVLGSCENGTRKLLQVAADASPRPGQQAALPAAAVAAAQAPRPDAPPARKPVRKDDAMLVECVDGDRITDGPCRP